ncbi:MAG: hypothetical protein CMI27_03015 [Opitutae bacterium]|nr:hypothetical protein [Opitutae bacterium]|tara:strand:+ start:8960 stop:9598 length:639 start_codon:yes stop_codon:yes gene_type:complete
MYLSNFQRTKNLLSYFSCHPFQIFRYFSKSAFSHSPLALGLPWWSFSSIDWMAKQVTKQTKVFEWGSGGSTVFLSSLCKSIKSVEHEIKWLENVKKELIRNNLINCSLVLEKINLEKPSGFENSDYLNALDENFDLIIIDGEDNFGPNMNWSAREICFSRAERFINPGGYILVDDSWRYPKIKEISRAKDLKRHQGIGPCRKGITSTDIHFY